MIDFEKLESVIWDLDGTLLDSFGIFCEVMGDILPAFNVPIPDADVISRNYHGSLFDSIHNSLGGGLDPELVRSIEAAFLDLQNTHYEVIEHHLYRDGLRLAQHFGELSLDQVIVTNRENTDRLNASPNYIVKHSSLASLIHTVIAGDSNGHRKPKPEVIGGLLESEMIRPETTVVVGDQIVDLEFAHNIGARSVLVVRDHSKHLENLIPNRFLGHTMVVQSLDELIA